MDAVAGVLVTRPETVSEARSGEGLASVSPFPVDSRGTGVVKIRGLAAMSAFTKKNQP